MAKTPEEMLESMKGNLLKNTGKSLDDWAALVATSRAEWASKER